MKLEVALAYEFFSSFFGPQHKPDEATEVKTLVLNAASAGLCEDNRRTRTYWPSLLTMYRRIFS